MNVDRFAFAALLICGVAVASAYTLRHARGHSAPSGFEYAQECCNSADCAPVPDSAVAEAQGGYTVLIRPGEHPMLAPGAEPVRRFIPHGDPRIRPSGDGHKHACVSPYGAIYCVYVPPGGV